MPYNYILETGTIVPDASTVITDVQNEFKTALGADLDTSASTPQGVLISTETNARSAVLKNNADLANQINPAIATGRYLDAICGLMDIQRGTTSPTYLNTMYIVGTNGTVVPAFTRIQTPDGFVFRLPAATTIPGAGFITANFYSDLLGPVNVQMPSLGNNIECTILDAVSGLTNVQIRGGQTTLALGNIALTDDQLRTQRVLRLMNQGRSSIGAIYAAVLKVPNVLAVNVRQNTTNAAGSVDGITFASGHAVYVCVDGGLDFDVAKALYGTSSGSKWDGGAVGEGGATVSQAVTDPYNGQSYTVVFRRPAYVRSYISITVSQGTNVSDLPTAVRNAIIAYATGQVANEPGLTVGTDLTAFEISGAVNTQLPGIFVRDCRVGIAPTPTSYTAAANPWQRFTVASGDILVTVV